MTTTTVQKWAWDYLVQPRAGRRRQREYVTVELQPGGWTAGNTYPRYKTCDTMIIGWINGEPCGLLEPDEWRTFHQQPGPGESPGIPTIWQVTHGTKNHRRRAYYCDAHLPDEFRPDGYNPT
jgi:hypothetical protein